MRLCTVKPVLSGCSKRRPKLVFNAYYRLMQVKSIAECSKGSILQYFRPSFSYFFSLRSLFCLFLSGRLRQVLLYLLHWPAAKKAQMSLLIHTVLPEPSKLVYSNGWKIYSPTRHDEYLMLQDHWKCCGVTVLCP